MSELMTVPVWLVALLLAAAAPTIVRFVAEGIERRVRQRTELVLARAATIHETEVSNAEAPLG